MIVLGLETSGEAGSVGILLAQDHGAEINFQAKMKHGEKTLPAIEAAMHLAGISKEDLDLIAIGTGPGSFTGLRIGIATAKGLGDALEIPIVGVPSASVFEGTTRFWKGIRWIIFPDRQDWIYAVSYLDEKQSGEIVVYDLHDFVEALGGASDSMFFVGPGAEKHRAFLSTVQGGVVASEALNRPSGIAVARVGLEKFSSAGQNSSEEIEPLYLQPPLANAKN